MNQNAAILKHLLRKSLTPLEALEQYGCFRLAARIGELREQGHDIRTSVIRNSQGKRFARYSLNTNKGKR